MGCIKPEWINIHQDENYHMKLSRPCGMIDNVLLSKIPIPPTKKWPRKVDCDLDESILSNLYHESMQDYIRQKWYYQCKTPINQN
jgi:hypothetical protein